MGRKEYQICSSLKGMLTTRTYSDVKTAKSTVENISSNKAWAKQEKVTDNKQDLADISEETDCLIIKK